MRRTLALFALPLVLGGCSTIRSTLGLGSGDSVPGGTVTSQVQHAGMTVADEPLAARTGAKVLQEGGSAADAVTTMFFTLTATYPVGAGLGGGGICLVRDPGTAQVREYDFLARTPAGGGAFAVPAAVRGFYDLQNDFGALPWQRMVAPGEAYAATGFPISDALSARVNAAVNVVRLDASLAAEFLDESGQPKPQGTVVTNPDLAQTLSLVRLQGPDGFFKGATASRLAAYSAAQGGAITLAELADAPATKGRAAAHTLGPLTVWLPGPGTGAGAFSGALLDNLRTAQAGGQVAASAVESAARQSLTRFGVTNLPKDMGSTGFAAVDAKGQAAACAVTLNGPFGSGRTAAGTGVPLASSPAIGQSGLASAFLTPVIATSDGSVTLVGAGSGGPGGTAATVYALLQATSGQLLSRDSVRSTGTAPFDTVNVISCTDEACVAIPDPGAHGQGAAPDLSMPR